MNINKKDFVEKATLLKEKYKELQELISYLEKACSTKREDRIIDYWINRLDCGDYASWCTIKVSDNEEIPLYEPSQLYDCLVNRTEDIFKYSIEDIFLIIENYRNHYNLSRTEMKNKLFFKGE